ncbi:MAG: glutaredoxin family protein [Actinomycetes bacterium]|jgi:glutaredoxin
MRQVQIYSRMGCHLCEEALRTLEVLQKELNFEIQEIFIEGDADLEYKYGEQVPVIQIDHVQHDFFTVNPVRFRDSFNASL